MKKLTYIVWLTFISLQYGQNKVGTTAAEFLTIPVGAKAVAMGGAFVAVADDITAAFWNPAGLSLLSNNEFNVNYSDWLLDLKHSWVGVGVKISDNDYVAVSVINMNYGAEPITTVDYPEGTGETWDAADLAIYLSYSHNLTDRFSVGGSVKYIHQRIWNESASTFAFDVGLLFKTQMKGFNIGMSISNFGKEMQLDGNDLLRPIDIDQSYNYNNSVITSTLSTDKWEIPLVFSVGGAWELGLIENLGFLVAFDAKVPNNQNTYLNLGGELQWNDLFFIRGGRSCLFKERAQEGLTFGAGIKYLISGLKLSVEYAFLDFGEWNNLNRFSISIGF